MLLNGVIADGFFMSGKSERKKRPANPVEMPPKLAESVPSHQTTKMQANLLSRREDLVLGENTLTVAIDAALSIHIMATHRSDRSWVRIVPDRDMSVRPMSVHTADQGEGGRLACCDLVEDGEAIFLDCGTTMHHFAQRRIEGGDRVRSMYWPRNEVLYARVDIYLAAKKWDMAAAVAGHLVKVDPGNPGAWITPGLFSSARREYRASGGRPSQSADAASKGCLDRFQPRLLRERHRAHGRGESPAAAGHRS